jgi:hypothetical protein
MIQRIFLYLTLGLLVESLGDTWQWWCFLLLFWAADQIGRQEGENDATFVYVNALEDAARGMKEANQLAMEYKQQLKELKEQYERQQQLRTNLPVDGTGQRNKDLL